MRRRNSAFTLIEIMIGFFILIIFFGIVYQIFIGGAKTSEKARWTNTAITQLRNSTALLSGLIKGSSMPVTLLANAVKDATNSGSTKWNLKVMKAGTTGRGIVAHSSLAGEKKIMEWYVCESEKIDPITNAVKPGVENYYELLFDPQHYSSISLGTLKLRKTTQNFTTSAATNYAESGTLTYSNKKEFTTVLIDDVASLSVDVVIMPGVPMPLTLNLSCRSWRDTKAHKESEITATPMVPVIELP